MEWSEGLRVFFFRWIQKARNDLYILIFWSRIIGNKYPTRITCIIILPHLHTVVHTMSHVFWIPLDHRLIIRLGGYLYPSFLLMVNKSLVLSFEFYAWIHRNNLVVLLKLLPAVLVFEGGDNISDILVFSKKSLVLASALHGSSRGDKKGHLFEDFVCSEYREKYLRCSFNFSIYLLYIRYEINLKISCLFQKPSLALFDNEKFWEGISFEGVSMLATFFNSDFGN